MEQTNPPDSPRIQGDRRSRSPTRPAHLLERSFSGGQVNLARAGRNVSPGPQLHEAPPLGGLYPWESGGSLEFHLDVAPQPIASFYYSPFDPTMFDTIQFNDSSTDPANAGFQAWTWSFGDGSTGSGCCVTHRYPADGDYTVKLTVTTIDGRTASTTQTVLVKTHDVAITKFTAPQSASAGQTRQSHHQLPVELHLHQGRRDYRQSHVPSPGHDFGCPRRPAR